MSKIALSGSPTGTGVFTIESPSSNTSRVLTLPDEAGTVLTTGSTGVVTSAMLTGDAIPLGVGQSWTDVSGSRSMGVTYTNSTGKPIMVSIAFADNSGNHDLVIDGVIACRSYNNISGTDSTVVGIVPNDSEYITSVGSFTIWAELR